MSDTYRLTVAVRRSIDLEHPLSESDAINLVRELLEQSDTLDVLSVVPEQTGPSNQVRWG